MTNNSKKAWKTIKMLNSENKVNARDAVYSNTKPNCIPTHLNGN